MIHQSGRELNLNWGSAPGRAGGRGLEGGNGPTWGIALDDGQVVQLECSVAATAGETDDVVLSVIDELGAFLNVDVVSTNVEHHPNVALVLVNEEWSIRKRRLKKEADEEEEVEEGEDVEDNKMTK